MIVARGRATRQDSLLSVLAIAAERGMPLAPAVAGVRRSVPGPVVQADHGPGRPDQLGDHPSRGARAVAQAGLARCGLAGLGRSGRRPAAAGACGWPPPPGRTSCRSGRRSAARLSYILGLLLVMQTISSFILYFIMPKFEAIFKDFNVSLPQVTILVIDASHLLIKFGYITICHPADRDRLARVSAALVSGRGVIIRFPLFDRLLGRRHTALVLRSLALTVEGGKPIVAGPVDPDAALSDRVGAPPAAGVSRKKSVRGPIGSSRSGITGLIRPADADVLTSAAQVGNLDWALLELAETAERRLATRVQMVVQTLFPLVVVMLGMAVFIMAMAYFVPLVALITELTRQ